MVSKHSHGDIQGCTDNRTPEGDSRASDVKVRLRQGSVLTALPFKGTKVVLPLELLHADNFLLAERWKCVKEL